ncbi:MAG: hypothetical protein EOO05_05615 [Chitinophagaceae bacterium]|nr:MAG: hypothetical protein EOO05_05615 [Chitinophagaceae bacterium]
MKTQSLASFFDKQNNKPGVDRSIISMEGSSFLQLNIRFGLVALLVGLVINLFFLVFAPQLFSVRQFVLSFVVSICITLSIANMVAFFQMTRFANTSRFWVFIGSYYVFNIVGMLLGTEISFYIVNLLLEGRITPRFHPHEYPVNTAIVMVVGTLVLFYYFQKADKLAAVRAKESDLIRLSQLQSEAQLQALQSKINPHFLYNALNSIASLIHENPDRAEEMTIKLSKLFRYSISKGQENIHPLKDELEILRTYIDIERVRFGDRMIITIDSPVELDHYLVPRFLIQPLVENSIKHGLKNAASNAEIRVLVRLQDQRLLISVYDNGTPFPDEMEMGYGIQSSYDKLRLLYKDNYDLQLVNQPKHVLISIPTNV